MTKEEFRKILLEAEIDKVISFEVDDKEKLMLYPEIRKIKIFGYKLIFSIKKNKVELCVKEIGDKEQYMERLHIVH